MGYTHYWKFGSIPKGKTRHFEHQYQLAIKDCQKIIQWYSKKYGGLSGYSAHSNEYGGINFNGSREDGHETFIMREHLKQNESFNFCKTARKPYDEVVVACLIVLNHYLKGILVVSSDGEHEDWLRGQDLARRILKNNRLTIPISARQNDLSI